MEELPVKVAGVAVQVSCTGVADAVISGFVVSMITVAAAVPVQPPTATVNVYVPPFVTTGFCADEV